jgi:hypothetical protein
MTAGKTVGKTSMQFALLLSILLAGCTNLGNGALSQIDRSTLQMLDALTRMEVTLGDEVSRVPNFMLRSWTAINDMHLVVNAGVHDHYLLTLDLPCPDLDFAFSIAIQSRTMHLTTFDTILVNSLHGPRDRCTIRTIHRLDDIEAD